MAVLGASALIWGAIFCILRFLTDSPVPALDALTTMLNIVGTWVLAQKIIEVWGIWFLVNAISIYIYCRRGLHLTTILLYSFYLGASVYGYIKWRRRGTPMIENC
jgi:nicotinamide mononucleotide transporter